MTTTTDYKCKPTCPDCCPNCGQGHPIGKSCPKCRELASTWSKTTDVLANLPAVMDESPVLVPLTTTPERFASIMAYHGINVRYDVRGMRPQVDMDGKGWQDLTDGVTARIRERLATVPFPIGGAKRVKVPVVDGEAVTMKVPDTTIGGVLDMSIGKVNESLAAMFAHHETDPLIEYIEELPEWDRVPRLELWLQDCFDVADASLELAAWSSVFIFLGTIQRAYKPGSDLQETPVLIGKGGIGKSTCLRFTMPPHLRYMFSDGLNLAANPKERVEALQGKAIVEAAEMQGARRADLESLKAFLSRNDDGSTRLAFRHNPEPMPRRCVLIGTADRPDPLPDDPNLRRFVPVTLEGGDAAATRVFMDRYRDQLWAEALTMHHAGRDARLPEALKGLQAEATETARSRNQVLEDAIDGWLETAPDTFSTVMVAEGIGMATFGETAKMSATDTKRIGGVLHQRGYKNTTVRVDGRTVRRWMREA